MSTDSFRLRTRREFLSAAAAACIVTQAPLAFGFESRKQAKVDSKLDGEIGVTTGSLMRHLTIEPQAGKVRLLDFPKIMRDDLDMRVIDLMTRTLASMEPAYLDELRNRSEKAGCIITNLKMNQTGLDMASLDKETRERALTEYKRTIDAAQRLGCRWVRPAPGPTRPDIKQLAASYRKLIDYAAPKGISLLIENNGWIKDDPEAIPTVLSAVGEGLAAAPDTGNWTDPARFEGLAKAFPHAVTCDFKAFMFGPEGEHPRYDLKRCFDVAWKAGFRGPWCLEHFNDTLDGLLAGFVRLRDMLKAWMKAS